MIVFSLLIPYLLSTSALVMRKSTKLPILKKLFYPFKMIYRFGKSIYGIEVVFIKKNESSLQKSEWFVNEWNSWFSFLCQLKKMHFISSFFTQSEIHFRFTGFYIRSFKNNFTQYLPSVLKFNMLK